VCGYFEEDPTTYLTGFAKYAILAILAKLLEKFENFSKIGLLYLISKGIVTPF